jgi:hypothetical protein
LLVRTATRAVGDRRLRVLTPRTLIVSLLFLDFSLAVASGIFGIGLLYASWTQRLGSRPLVIVVGWAVVVVSVIFWVRFGGVEFGIVWATRFARGDAGPAGGPWPVRWRASSWHSR